MMQRVTNYVTHAMGGWLLQRILFLFDNPEPGRDIESLLDAHPDLVNMADGSGRTPVLLAAGGCPFRLLPSSATEPFVRFSSVEI
jgi:hypothetical protein